MKSILKIIVINVCLCIYIDCFSQGGVAINKAGTLADPSAILDVSSDDAGILIPRMTKAQRNSINSPAEGLLIYQIDDTVGFWYHSFGIWKLIGSGTGSSIVNGTATGNTLYWDGSKWAESSNIYNAGSSVGIGTISPDVSAGLDISFNDKGFLMPRLTSTQRNNIVNPASGLQIYNISTGCFEFYNGSTWKTLSCGCDVSAPVSKTHIISDDQIIWNWSSVPGATGYKYNSVNNYTTAIDNGPSTTYTQTGLTCNSSYTLYVWAYNECGNSNVLVLNANTPTFCCGINSITDSRDGNTYQTVKIGSQCWMKENLKYLPSVVGTSVYSTTVPYYYVYGYNGTNVATAKSQANYSTYGVLYNWPAAMGCTSSCSPSGSNINPSGVQGVCPTGWHLPSKAEYEQLLNYLVGNPKYWCGFNDGEICTARSLAATSGWSTAGATCQVGNNQAKNDLTGFSGRPGGYAVQSGSSIVFGNLNSTGKWWTTSIAGGGNECYCLDLYYQYYSPVIMTNVKSLGASVRCVKDN